MKAYKVIAKRNGMMLSFVRRHYNSTVEYKKDEWAEPVGSNGPLAVFRSYYDADDFSRRITLADGVVSEIWECEIKESELRKFWDMDGETLGAPNGTLFADRVMLLKEIA